MGQRLAGVVMVVLACGAGAMRGQVAAEHGMAHAASTPSTGLTVKVGSGVLKLSVAEMAGMPQKEITVVNGHSGKEERYTGVLLSDVLVKAGAKLGKETLHGYVVAKGTDGYWVLYSGEEISPALHSGDVLVATAVNGQPLLGDGAVKLVSSEDKKPERWVRNLTEVDWKVGVE